MKQPARNANSPQQEVRIEYQSKQVLYASQFAVSGSDEELILDVSGGVLQDPQSGQLILPVHSRLAMTHHGARRLITMLRKALERGGEVQGNSPDTLARLPKFEPPG